MKFDVVLKIIMMLNYSSVSFLNFFLVICQKYHVLNYYCKGSHILIFDPMQASKRSLRPASLSPRPLSPMESLMEEILTPPALRKVERTSPSTCLTVVQLNRIIIS
jgi:hypothetical protein